jgi:hypothetical protein
VSPILGIWASGAQAAANAGSFESIATVTVGSGGSSTITFSSIPSTYTHLQLRVTEQCSVFDKWRQLQFNSDTTASNYTLHTLYGDGSSVAVYTNTSSDWYYYEAVSSHSTTSMAGYVIDILDYANTNKYKTVRFLGGHDNNGSGIIWFNSKLWRNTNAISSIDLKLASGNFVQYSHFALYGIKSA